MIVIIINSFSQPFLLVRLECCYVFIWYILNLSIITSVFCGTYNVNSQSPTEPLDKWLCTDGDQPDIYFIGLVILYIIHNKLQKIISSAI